MMDIDVITKLPGFFNSNYYCLQCEKAYFNEDYEHHSCHKTKCCACLQSSCPDYELFKQSDKPDLPCKDCGRHFDGVTCQLNHLTCKPNGQLVAHDEKNVCKSHKNCSTCLHVFSSSVQEHMKHCGLRKCPSCSKEVNILQHKCYLQAVTHKKKRKGKNKEPQHTVFVYFDIDAHQDTGDHVANLVCAETDQNDGQFNFKGEHCIYEFLQWVHTIANQPNVEKVIVVAHNFKGYVGYFILEELYKQHVTNLSQIVNGAKILSLEIPNVKFIDSMNFFRMALSNFPETFRINELKKGYFPHFFNIQKYAGYMPDESYYDADGMSPARKEEFLRWYDDKVFQRYVFDFQDELLTYCQSDVRLLKQGCMTFQSQFKDIVNFNPMKECITIASACSVAYRKQ